MEALLDALENTPWYVYLIFLYVVYIGIISLRPRTVNYRVIFILPTVLTLWSLSASYERWDGGLLGFGIWAFSLLIGMVIGWLILRFYKLRVDKGRGTITLPGNKWTLILVLSLFTVRYTYGYLYATLDSISKSFTISDLAISGLLIGIFIGRALHYYRLYEKAR